MKLTLIASTLITLSAAVAILPTTTSGCTPFLLEIYLFQDPLSTFLDHRAHLTPPCFDWTSDGCSFAPDNPLGFPFHNACLRHDFGYRNYRVQGMFNETNRVMLDGMFLGDLMGVCEKEKLEFERKLCGKVARGYWRAVRRCGDGDCFDDDEVFEREVGKEVLGGGDWEVEEEKWTKEEMEALEKWVEKNGW